MIDHDTQTNDAGENPAMRMRIAHIITPDWGSEGSDKSEEAKTEEQTKATMVAKGSRDDTGFSESLMNKTKEERKAKAKRRLKICTYEGCTSHVRAFNRCKKHGGLRKCSVEGCHQKSQTRGLCIR